MEYISKKVAAYGQFVLVLYLVLCFFIPLSLLISEPFISDKYIISAGWRNIISIHFYHGTFVIPYSEHESMHAKNKLVINLDTDPDQDMGFDKIKIFFPLLAWFWVHLKLLDLDLSIIIQLKRFFSSEFFT